MNNIYCLGLIKKIEYRNREYGDIRKIKKEEKSILEEDKIRKIKKEN